MAQSDLLRQVRVASPCGAAWDQMEGDERRRFCRQCGLNVYNLSEMSRNEAEELVRSAEGRLCVRFYHRRDGSVLTRNCPVGFGRARRALLLQASALGAVFLSIPAVAAAWTRVRSKVEPAVVEPLRQLAIKQGWIKPPPPPRVNPFARMGELRVLPPPAPLPGSTPTGRSVGG
jgi:hypothetical protein